MPSSTPARAPKKKTVDTGEYEDIVVKSRDDDSFVAEIFDDETFTFSTDINGFLLLNSVSGGGEFINLLDSLVLIDDADAKSDSELEDIRDAERERFHTCLGRQKKLSVERLARLVNDITEIAGNDSDGSSSSG